MTTIQEAMDNSSSLIAAAQSGKIDPAQLQAEVTRLLSSPVDARGFMASLVVNDLPQNKSILEALVQGLRSGKTTAYELIIKNVIMSGCAAQHHAKTGHLEESELSKRTSERCVQLAKLVDDQALASVAKNAIEAINTCAAKNKAEDDYWQQFFSRWGYTEASLKGVLEPLKTIASVFCTAGCFLVVYCQS